MKKGYCTLLETNLNLVSRETISYALFQFYVHSAAAAPFALAAVGARAAGGAPARLRDRLRNQRVRDRLQDNRLRDRLRG